MTVQRSPRHLARAAYVLPLIFAACSVDGSTGMLEPYLPEVDSSVVSPDATITPPYDAGYVTQYDASNPYMPVALDAALDLDAGDGSAGDAGDAGELDGATHDASADAGMDASSDAATDSGEPADASTDAATDAAIDAGTDAAVVDASTDAATTDAAVDAGGYPYVRGAAPTSDSAAKAGPYTVQNYNTGYRDGPDFTTGTIFYPSNADAPFALVVLTPDEFTGEATIQPWARFFASHGIVAMSVTANLGINDSAVRASAALLDALVTLKAENTRTGSPLRGKLDTAHTAVLGANQGGDGALITAAAHAELNAAVSLFAEGTRTFASDTVPALLIASQGDTYGKGKSQPMYASIPNTVSKLLYDLTSGSATTANDPANAGGSLGRFGLSWLKLFLEGDTRYKPLLLVRPSPVSDYQTTLN